MSASSFSIVPHIQLFAVSKPKAKPFTVVFVLDISPFKATGKYSSQYSGRILLICN